MRVKLQALEDDTEGSVFLPIPEEMLRELGWKDGDLLEVVPFSRNVYAGEEKTFVENLIQIRRARM